MAKEKQSVAKMAQQAFFNAAWGAYNDGESYTEVAERYNEFLKDHAEQPVTVDTVRQKVAAWAKKGIPMPAFPSEGEGRGGGNKIDLAGFDLSVVPQGAKTYTYKARGPRKAKDEKTIADVVAEAVSADSE